MVISGEETISPGYEIEGVVGYGFGVKRGKCCSYASSLQSEGGLWGFGWESGAGT